jgi:hypothetical protein
MRGMMNQGPERSFRSDDRDLRQGRSPARGSDSLRMALWKKRMDSVDTRGNMLRRGPIQMNRPDGFPGWAGQMRRGQGMMPPPMYRGWYQARPDLYSRGPVREERGIAGIIPDLTDKQKEAISDIRKKQQDEMRKIEEEFGARMKTLRETNRTRVLSLLTDEQKKAIGVDNSKTTPGNSGKTDQGKKK